MKFTRNGSVQIIAGVLAGAGALVAACGGDDATVDDGTPDAGADTGGSTTSSSGATSSTSSSGGSTSTSTSSGATDASVEAGGDGGKKANGEACAQPTECESGVCFVGDKNSYCTIKCTMLNDEDPACEALKGDFTGECNKQGFCRKN